MNKFVLSRHKAEAYMQGVKDTLLELREVYGEGLEETDLWAEVMKEETN